METDARGQLGGVETTDNVRRRLAGDSSSFKCSTCGKSNAEIIRESEARCAEQGESSADPVEVPSELKLGYRDEIEGKGAEASKNIESASTDVPPFGTESAETAELAEGFVQTVPQAATSLDNPAALASNPHAAPGQGAPQPTAQIENGALPRPAQVALPPARRQSDDGVPLWIDRAIVVLVVLLAALLLKIMFDF
jgi:ubiquitin-conjugating enzyme E2 J1